MKITKRDEDQMPTWIPRATFTVIGAVLLTYVSIKILGRVEQLVSWLIMALFLSFAIEPVVNTLEKRGWKRGAATGLILGGLILLLLVLVGAMVPLVISQVKDLVASAPIWVNRISDTLNNWFGVHITTEQLLDKIQSANLSLASTTTNIAGNLLTITTKIVSAVFETVTVFLFTYYLVSEGPKVRRKLLTLLPKRQQKIVLETWEIAIDKTGGYLYSRLALGVISSIAALIVLSIIGVPFALPLALWFGFISQFIPVVGTYIAAAIPILVALLENPWSALVFLIYIVLYQQIENYVLSPKITAHTMQLHPAVAIIAALAGGSIKGALGAFLALPLAAIIQSSVGTYLIRHDVIEADGDLLGIDADDAAKIHKISDKN